MNKRAGRVTGLAVLGTGPYPETYHSGPPDDTQNQGYHGQYDQDMDQASDAVHEYT